MSQQTDSNEVSGQAAGSHHERPPYHRPLFGSLGGWIVRLGAFGAAVSLGFMLGAGNPDANHLLAEAKNELKRERAKVGVAIGVKPETDIKERPIQPACLNPPHSKPIVGMAGVHSEGAAGFDLSAHMKAIPYRSLRQHSVDFVYLRATRGSSSHEADFPEAWHNLSKCDVARGVIHDFRPDHAVDKQIANVMKHTGGQFGELPAVVDVERAHGTKRHRCEVSLPKLMEFIEALEQQSKHTVVLKTSGEFWNAHYDCAASRDSTVDATITDRPLWVVDPDKASPQLPNQWSDWALWQRSSKGRLGRDEKVAVDTFNGSSATFREWVLDSKKG
jgi:lysozyme